MSELGSVNGSDADVSTTEVTVPMFSQSGALAPQQQIVAEYFSAEWAHRRLDKRFLGALRVYSDEENTERLCLTAHSLREIMNAMERSFSGEPPAGLKDRCNSFLQNVASERAAAQLILAQSASVPIDLGSTGRYLKLSEDFLRKYEEEKGLLDRRAENLLMGIDASLKGSAPGWKARLVKEWRDLKDTFSNLAHSEPISAQDFDSLLSQWLAFVIARARPQTTDDQEQIRALIQQLEK